MTGDNYRKELWLNLSLAPRVYSDENLPQQFFTSYIFNMDSGAFTTQSETQIMCLAYNPYLMRTVTAVYDGVTTSKLYRPSTQLWCKPRVVFNPLVAGDMGTLKQWMDVNFFFQEMQLQSGFIQGLILASFDEQDAPSERVVTASTVDKSHYWVPRRCAMKEQLIVGFSTVVIDDSITGTFDFNLYGFTVRFRVASDTLKRT
jgi:hypothetical protein